MTEIELWKPILGWEENYEVSNRGRVRSLINPKRVARDVPKILAIKLDKAGRPTVSLTKFYAQKTYRVSCLVLSAFISPRPPGLVCAHLDGNAQNNCVENLAWVPQKENIAHKKIHGTQLAGEKMHNAKLTNDQANQVRAMLGLGLSRGRVAQIFSVGYWVIKKIATGKTYKETECKN